MRVATLFFGSAAAQGMAALTGLLLAHLLPKHDYAIYTVMAVIMGAMTVLTRGGVNLGYTALLGRDWPDLQKVDALGKLVGRVRRMMSALMLPPISLVSAILLYRVGASAAEGGVLLLLLLASWYFDMQTRVIDQILFFAKQAVRVQMMDTALNLIRLVGTAALVVVHGLNAVAALTVSVAIAALRVGPIVHWIRAIVPASPNNQPSDDDYNYVRKTALRQVPSEIFMVFQTQIMLFALSFFAGTTSVADYGALSRIGQLLNPIQTLSYSLLIPIFSSATDRILSRFVSTSLLCSLPAVLLVLVSWLFPNTVLLLIGAKYADLQGPLLIAMVNAAVYSSLGIAWNLLAHRGLNHYAWLQIPVGLGWCLSAPLLLDLSRLSGALWLQAGFSLGYLVAIIAEIVAAKRRAEL